MKTNAFRTIFIWVLIITVFLLFSLWVFLIYKSYFYRGGVARISEETSSKQNRDSYLASIRNVLRRTEGGFEVIERRFIKENDVPTFIKFLEGQAEIFRVKADLNGITLDPVLKNSIFRILRIRVNGSGYWEDAISFVHALDMMPYETRIDRVSFSKLPETIGDLKIPKTSKPSWSVVVDISQYVK
ncbi:MAG: hypothetical protein AAB484_03365 [Patescibacteria group bacterium]